MRCVYMCKILKNILLETGLLLFFSSIVLDFSEAVLFKLALIRKLAMVKV